MRDFTDLLAQVHFDGAVDPRDEQHQAGTFRPDAAAQAEDHQALVLIDNADGIRNKNDHSHHDKGDDT